MSSVEVLSGRVFLVVTGASRGIGKQIALSLASLLEKGSHVLLLARNLDGLKETASTLPKGLKADCVSIDLSKTTCELFDEILRKSLGHEAPGDFDRAVVVHNAGAMGDVSKTTIDLTDLKEWQDNLDLNLFSSIFLNSAFMKVFDEASGVKKLVINITSLCCTEPIKSMGIYGPAKAAKEMYFKVFALEFPNVNVINYSPGPVATEMFDKFVKNSSDPEIRSQLGEMRDQKKILSPEQTADRLISILRDQNYKSGDHVYYYH